MHEKYKVISKFIKKCIRKYQECKYGSTTCKNDGKTYTRTNRNTKFREQTHFLSITKICNNNIGHLNDQKNNKD